MPTPLRRTLDEVVEAVAGAVTVAAAVAVAVGCVRVELAGGRAAVLAPDGGATAAEPVAALLTLGADPGTAKPELADVAVTVEDALVAGASVPAVSVPGAAAADAVRTSAPGAVGEGSR
jgi:hypothetical protein